IDPSLLVGGREAGGKSIPADRCLARIEKHDIVRHQAVQADKIACVDGIDPGRVHLADCSFIRSHLQPLPPNATVHPPGRYNGVMSRKNRTPPGSCCNPGSPDSAGHPPEPAAVTHDLINQIKPDALTRSCAMRADQGIDWSPGDKRSQYRILEARLKIRQVADT